jgi:hypothetical protein
MGVVSADAAVVLADHVDPLVGADASTVGVLALSDAEAALELGTIVHGR